MGLDMRFAEEFGGETCKCLEYMWLGFIVELKA